MQQDFVCVHEKNILGIYHFAKKHKKLPNIMVIPQTHIMLDKLYNSEIKEETLTRFIESSKMLFDLMIELTLTSDDKILLTEETKKEIYHLQKIYNKNLRDIHDERHWVRYSAALSTIKMFENMTVLTANTIGTLNNKTKECTGKELEQIIGGYETIMEHSF